MDYYILSINPGSTSTKIAVFKNEEEIFNESLEHSQAEIDQYKTLLEQIPMRQQHVLDALTKHHIDVKQLSIVMGRGGLFPPIDTGGYKVNQRMLDMVMNEEIPSHASNLGCVLAYEIAQMANVDAFIYDAVSSGKLAPMAAVTGLHEIVRKTFYHVLNSRAMAIKYAKSIDKNYEDLNLIVAHLGGGITIGAHEKGVILDSLSDDNGPFAPERSGGVPLLDFIEICYSGKYSKKEMIKRVRGIGGLRDLLGTSNGKEISKMVEQNDENAILVMHALAYQIAKGIGLLLPVLKGKVDAIILTGGLAHSEKLIKDIKPYIEAFAPIIVMSGEHEMSALALGGLRIIKGEEQYHEM